SRETYEATTTSRNGILPAVAVTSILSASHTTNFLRTQDGSHQFCLLSERCCTSNRRLWHLSNPTFPAVGVGEEATWKKHTQKCEILSKSSNYRRGHRRQPGVCDTPAITVFKY